MTSSRQFQKLLILTAVTTFSISTLGASDALASRANPNFKNAHYDRKPSPHFRMPLRYNKNVAHSYVRIIVSGNDYYYHNSYFYRQTPRGYVIVRPPVGAVIHSLPYGYEPVHYHGQTYYQLGENYYRQESNGYVVVNAPSTNSNVQNVSQEEPIRSIIVNMPNSNGSYIPITIDEYRDGFRGPNGEYYAKQPTVQQLQAMYSLKSDTTAELESLKDLTIDVPNSNGSFTQVVLMKTKDGYTGPQGEFYPSKPTLEQLEMMYAKK